MGADRAHDRQGRQDGERARRCGTASPRRPGTRPIPACSSTPRSTTGTPARTSGRINASNPCSEYMFLDDTACNLASLNLMRFRKDDGSLDVGAAGACDPPVDGRARDFGDDGAVPLAPDRRAVLPVPHAGPGLRQPRRAADGVGPGLRLRPRPGDRRRRRRGHDRHGLRDLGRDGRPAWAPSRALPPIATPCCG